MSLLDEASLIVTPNGYKGGSPNGKLYSVKPTNGDGDMVVTRGSSATRVNSAGFIEIARTNLVLQSQTLENASWTPTNVTVTANTTSAPDGTTTADTITGIGVLGVRLIQSNSISFTASTSYSLSVFAKKGTNDFIQLFVPLLIGGMHANFNINTGVVGTLGTVTGTAPTSSITNFGNGWYRCTINFTATTTISTVTSISIVTSASAIRSEQNTLTTSLILWGAQLEASNIAVATEYIPTVASIRTKFAGITQDGGFGSNIPRIDYPPLGGCPSILVEPERTNQFFYSEQFDNGYWEIINSTITANDTVAPDGTMTADKFIPNTANSTHQIRKIALTSNAYTFSVFAKAGGETIFSMWLLGASVRAEFNLSNGTIIINTTTSAKIENYGNGWYRCSVYSSTPGTTFQIYGRNGGVYEGNNVDGIFFWGAQAEVGANATSYIPTVASTLTRTADVITKTGISSLIGQTEGTIFWDVKDLVGSVNSGNPEFMIRNTAFTNWIGITTNSSANPFRITVRPIGGSSIIDYSANITSAKACVKYGTFGAKLFLNGNPTPVATTAVNPNISFDNILFSGARISYKTNSFALWTTALTDEQCISLTT